MLRCIVSDGGQKRKIRFFLPIPTSHESSPLDKQHNNDFHHQGSAHSIFLARVLAF